MRTVQALAALAVGALWLAAAQSAAAQTQFPYTHRGAAPQSQQPAQPPATQNQPTYPRQPQYPPTYGDRGPGRSQPAACSARAQTTLTWRRDVTIDYLRMYEPEAVAQIADAVRAGRAPAAALNGLASAEAIQRVRATDWSPALAALRQGSGAAAMARAAPPSLPPCPDAPGPMSNFGRRPPGIAGVQAAADPALRLTNAARQIAGQMLLKLIDLDASPNTLDFGNVMVDEHRREAFRVVTMNAGTLVIQPARDSNLRIVGVTAESGLIDPNRAEPPPADTQLPVGAPAQVRLAAGQAATVVVELLPTRAEGFTGAPLAYTSTITLALTQPGSPLLRATPGSPGFATPTLTVGAAAQVAGEYYGIGVWAEAPLTYAHIGHAFLLFYNAFNDHGATGDAMVRVDTGSLPPGVTPSGPTTARLHFDAGQDLPDQYFQLNGPPQLASACQANISACDPRGVVNLIVTQTTPQGTQSKVVAIPVELMDVSREFDGYDLVCISGRACIDYKSWFKESSMGGWTLFMNVYAEDGGNCSSYDDYTLVDIQPTTLFPLAGHFQNGNYRGVSYFEQAFEQALQNDFGVYAHAPIMSHQVTCYS
jgi:hypothetical protein